MELKALLEGAAQRGVTMLLDRILAQEVDAYLDEHRHERDAAGRAMVVRNGFGAKRTVNVGGVAIAVRPPRVNDRRVDSNVRRRFVSQVLPAGRAPRLGGGRRVVASYLCGWISGDFSGLTGHLAGAGIRIPAPLLAALQGQHSVDWSQRIDDIQFERLVVEVAPMAHAEAHRRSETVLGVVGRRRSTRATLVAATVGDPADVEAWRRVLVDARLRVSFVADALPSAETLAARIATVQKAEKAAPRRETSEGAAPAAA